jgi:hypothetical protein
MTIPSGPVPSFPNTIGLQDGKSLNRLAQLMGSVQNGITAQADGTKANATQITGVKAHVATSAGAADSVLLPPGYPGLEVTIFNGGASSIQVFGSGSDTINDIDTDTGVTQNNGISAVYTCYDVVAGVGIWGRVLSA